MWPPSDPCIWHPLAATTLNGQIYALGGLDKIGRYLNTVEAYDPRTYTWSSIAPMQSKRGEAPPAAATLNGKIYALGGVSAPGILLSSAEAYDPRTNTWSSIAPMKSKQYSLAAATL
jgi:N-acetylneuraminic acid mutarotase